MRFYKVILTLIAATFLCSCTTGNHDSFYSSELETDCLEPITAYIQQKEQLYLDIETEPAIKQNYTALNFERQIGMWFPYMDYENYMFGKSAEEFRNAVHTLYEDAKNQSVNTVYVHIRPNGDAYYNSSVFPKGIYLNSDYDPLQIMTEEAHSLGMSIHAWINPLRCQTEEQMKNISDDFILKQWADNHTGSYLNIVNGRYYLNPAYDEVIYLICKGVDEIVRNYNIDGVHIDDYFYPTTSPDFDKNSFEVSGHSDLAEWRLANCNRLVHSIYESVKRIDSGILFGISPQGNINANYSSQYADVRLWCSTVGYCDYIVPQLYYGFKNETCPFAETLMQWESLMSNENISLIIGLAGYKQGAEDKWAGTAGELEWIENPDLLRQQTELVETSSANGYAFYY